MIQPWISRQIDGNFILPSDLKTEKSDLQINKWVCVWALPVLMGFPIPHPPGHCSGIYYHFFVLLLYRCGFTMIFYITKNLTFLIRRNDHESKFSARFFSQFLLCTCYEAWYVLKPQQMVNKWENDWTRAEELLSSTFLQTTDRNRCLSSMGNPRC